VNRDIVNFFRVLRDGEAFARFEHMATMTPYSRTQYGEYQVLLRGNAGTDMERAWAYFVIARQSFAARSHHGTWGSSVTESARNMGAMNSK